MNFAEFKQKRDAYIERLHNIYDTNIQNSGVNFVEGTAEFVGPKRVKVSSTEEEFTADHILIARGGAPRSSGFEGAELCMTSDDFFAMDTLPKSIAVLGGGYIGVELA